MATYEIIGPDPGDNYTSPQAWYDAHKGNITSDSNAPYIGRIKKGTYSGGLVISGSTTDAAHYFRLEAYSRDEFKGNLSGRGTNYPYINGVHIDTVDYIQLSHVMFYGHVVVAYMPIVASHSNHVLIENCCACDSSGPYNAAGIHFSYSHGTIRCCVVANVQCTDGWIAGIDIYSQSTANIYNNTVFNVTGTTGSIGVNLSALGSIVRNNALCTDTPISSSLTCDIDYNAAVSSIAYGSHNQTGLTPSTEWVNVASTSTYDFHLKSTSVKLKGTAGSFVGYTDAPTIDIDGEPLYLDIGCDSPTVPGGLKCSGSATVTTPKIYNEPQQWYKFITYQQTPSPDVRGNYLPVGTYNNHTKYQCDSPFWDFYLWWSNDHWWISENVGYTGSCAWWGPQSGGVYPSGPDLIPGFYFVTVGVVATSGSMECLMPSTGAKLGGSATIRLQQTNPMSGGVAAGGSATTRQTHIHRVTVGPGKMISTLADFLNIGSHAAATVPRDLTHSYKVNISNVTGDWVTYANDWTFSDATVQYNGVTQCPAKIVEYGTTWLRFSVVPGTRLRLPQVGDTVVQSNPAGSCQIDEIIYEGEAEYIECYAFEDSGTVYCQGWYTDPQCCMKIYTPPSERHDGTFSTGYRCRGGGAYFVTNNLTVDGLTFDVIDHTRGSRGMQFRGTGPINVSNCLLRGSGMIFEISNVSLPQPIHVWNNVVATLNSSWNNFVFYNYNSSTIPFHVYNCTAYGGNCGFYQYNYTRCYYTNCIAASTASWGFYYYEMLMYNCASSDGSVGSSPSSRPWQTFLFANPANQYFQLLATDQGAFRRGKNLSSDPDLPFSTDILGAIRPAWGDFWSIGAFEGGVLLQGGGAKAGGGADIRYLAPVSTSGGTQASGQAVCVSKFVATGGIAVSGSAPILQRCQNVGLNGGKANGSASVSRISYFTASGGIRCNGYAIKQGNPYLASGGVSASGTSPEASRFVGNGGSQASGSATTIHRASNVASGGAASGGVIVSNELITPVLSGGLKCSGVAQAQGSIQNQSTSGGAQASGSANVMKLGFHVLTVGPGKDVSSLNNLLDNGNYAVGWKPRNLTASHKVTIENPSGSFSTPFATCMVKADGVTVCSGTMIEDGGTYLRFTVDSVLVRKPIVGDLVQTGDATATITEVVHDAEIQLVECYAFADSGIVYMHNYANSWVTSPQCYVKVYTPLSERHNGHFGTGYRMATGRFYAEIGDLWIDGLSLDMTETNTNWGLEFRKGPVKISNCLLKGSGLILTMSDPESNYIWNTVVSVNNSNWNCFTHYTYGPVSKSYFYNCTAYGGRYGFYAYSTVHITCKNCIAAAAPGVFNTGFYEIDEMTYCASSDASASGTTNRATQTFTFVDPLNRYLQLSLTDQGAFGRGIDLSQDSLNPFTTDISGQSRPVWNEWSIGAFEGDAADILTYGGVQAGGSALVSVPYIVVSGLGGIMMNGPTSINVQMQITMDSGTVVSGETDAVVYLPTSGGIAVGDGAVSDLSHNVTMNGGCQLGGSPLPNLRITLESTGSCEVSGQAEARTFIVGTGGASTATGEATIGAIYRGGLTAQFVSGGSALVQNVASPLVTTGGAAASGQAIRIDHVHISGGAKVNGSADYNVVAKLLPGSRVLSLSELNWLDQRMFVGEILEKTDSRGLMWDSLRAMTQFKTTDLPYDYYLTQTQFGITLDIQRNGRFFGTVSSEVEPFVRQIFDQVVMISKDDRRLDETFKTVWAFP